MTAAVALERLRADQAVRAAEARRAQLAAVGLRLDMAGRAFLTRELAGRVRGDARFAPVLRGLMRMSLTG